MFLNWKSVLTLVTSLSLNAGSVFAEPTKGFYSMDAMGCMILRECTKDVRRIQSINDIRKEFPNLILILLLMSLTRCYYPLIKSELWFF